MQKAILANDQYYHIYNRGVDKREIFLDTEDYQRFLHDMYEFNDTAATPPFVRRVGFTKSYNDIVGFRKSPSCQQRDKLVDIYCYCLMPNHFHFVLKQLKIDGITIFMRKLGVGYANYFNKKYERSGALFQGRFKAVLIETDPQIMHLSRYIHVLNPGEMVEPDIREGRVRDRERLDVFLKKYRWSSHLDYLGIKNYPSLINKDFISGYFKDVKEYENFVLKWKTGDAATLQDLTLD